MRFALAAVLCLLAFQSIASADQHIIAVNGTAERTLEPDLIALTVEVWSKAPNAKQAQALTATEYQRIKKVFETFKIKKEDISTDNYSLNPETVYDQKTQKNKMVGFNASQSINIVVRKVSDAGPFFDALSTSGKKDVGVNLNNLRWDSDKRAETEMAGLADAVKNARRKADEIARAAGVKVKTVARISHNTASENSPVLYRSRGVMLKESDSGGAPTELSAGSIKIRTDVQAEFEIN